MRTTYGGNYDAYTEQKDYELTASEQQLHDAKRLMQKTKNTIQLSREKHEQKQSYGKELRRSGRLIKWQQTLRKDEVSVHKVNCLLKKNV